MNAPARTPLHEEMRVASAIAAQIIAAGIDPDDPDYAELLSAETDVQDRLRRILRVARHIDAQSDALAGIIKADSERKARLDKKVVGLRGVALQAMSDLGLKRLDAPDFTATISAGRAKVIVTDETAIPGSYFVTTRTLDKRALAAALDDAPVPGAEKSNGGPSLTVKVR